MSIKTDIAERVVAAESLARRDQSLSREDRMAQCQRIVELGLADYGRVVATRQDRIGTEYRSDRAMLEWLSGDDVCVRVTRVLLQYVRHPEAGLRAAIEAVMARRRGEAAA
jgi:hypothetical protein